MITLTREEAQQVLEALLNYPITEGKAIQLLRARLSAPEPEPLGWVVMCEGTDVDRLVIYEVEQFDGDKPMPNQYRVYTAPPQREWQGLTDEEMRAAIQEQNITPLFTYRMIARAIEQALREKNS